ncbi:hypothetical protein HDV00_012301 [Rhizophlyctis rosea]|nr:hypothetical protein HDV00_012301 [Rhizophlyctis rosea]
MQARISFLEGERRGVENLKTDLVRRVKMLEYALRQERTKFLNLQQQYAGQQQEGASMAAENQPPPPTVPPAPNQTNVAAIADAALPASSQYGTIGAGGTLLNFSKGFGHARSREILKNYLREVGYLLSTSGGGPAPRGSTTGAEDAEGVDSDGSADGPTSILKREPTITASRLRGDATRTGERAATGTRGREPSRTTTAAPEKPCPRPAAAASRPKEDATSRPDTNEEKADVAKTEPKPPAEAKQQEPETDDSTEKVERPPRRATRPRSDVGDEKGKDAEEHMPLDQIQEQLNLPADKVSKLMSKWEGKSGTGKKASVADQKQKAIPSVVANAMALGEGDVLAALSLSEDDVDESVTKKGAGTNKGVEQKLWKPKATLRSHLDSVRSIAFHPTEFALLSASEDYTTKLWNLTGSDSRQSKTLADMEPIETLRGHTGPVTSVVVSADGDWCYTGSADATVRVWRMPSLTKEKYERYDTSLKAHTFIGHSDIVWDLKAHPLPQQFPIIASASSDGTVKLWDVTHGSYGLKSTLRYHGTSEGGEQQHNGDGGGHLQSPTSVDWLHTGLNRLVVAYQNSEVKVFDMETGKVVLSCKSAETFDGTSATQINRVICHPTLPLLITAHEDRYIRLFDMNTGECTHSQIGHLDGVTTVDVAPGGLTMATGGHDCSIRWWDLSTRSCIQEYTGHRKKNDEGVWTVKYHPSLQEHMASGGADGLCKVYHFGTTNG